MGLFSSLRNAKATPQHEVTARAVITPAVFVMSVDGSVDMSEIRQLANSCAFSPIFAPIPGERIIEMINEIAADFLKRTPDVVIGEAINTLSPGLRETAMAIAMRVALADGRLDDAEKYSLIMLSKDMGISENNAEVMLHVMAILQRGPGA